MIRAQVLLTPTLAEELRILARSEQKSLSATVRELLTMAINLKRGTKCAGDTLLEMAKHAVSGGPKDLSTNDDYLYRI